MNKENPKHSLDHESKDLRKETNYNRDQHTHQRVKNQDYRDQ